MQKIRYETTSLLAPITNAKVVKTITSFWKSCLSWIGDRSKYNDLFCYSYNI